MTSKAEKEHIARLIEICEYHGAEYIGLAEAADLIEELQSENERLTSKNLEWLDSWNEQQQHIEELQRQLDEALGALQRGPKMLPATGMDMINWNRQQAQRIREMKND